MEGSPSLNVTTLPGLVAIYIVVAEIKCFLINHANSRDHKLKMLCDTELKFLIVSQHSDKFGGHRFCGSSYTATKTFYVTLEGNFMEGNSWLCIPILQKLIVLDIVLMKM